MLANDLAIALDPALIMRRAGMNPDPWQAGLLRSTGKRHLLLCTRQAGKSTTTAALAVWEALYNAPALILLLSPSLRQSQELFRKVIEFYESLNLPRGEKSALRLELPNGSRIVALPGTEATIRGYSGVRLLIIDEASRVEDSLYYSVRPMLAVSGGRIIALTTPHGKRGFFHQEWENPQGWETVKITALQCPRITPEFLAEERHKMGEWWYSQEYMCEFRETSDQVFAYDLIQGAMNPDIKPLFPVGFGGF
jgi:hypothetical protein